MIHVHFEENRLFYDVRDVLKLFFRDEDIVETGAEPPHECQGAFLTGFYSEADGRHVFSIRLRAAGMSYTADIPVCGDMEPEDEYEIRKTLKNEVKRHIYLALSGYTGNEPPWGILTGIRPAKIVHEMLDKGYEREKILRRLNEYYRIASSKANLLYDVARNETSILEKNRPDDISVYIGIPFCTTRCLYCSFVSNSMDRSAHLVDRYLEALKYEIRLVNEIIKAKRYTIQSLYIGGGTPTSIDRAQLSELLESVEKGFDLSRVEEYTVEAGRPDSLDAGKLRIIKNSRTSRISINPQTMNDETLKLIGRCHTPEDTVRAFETAREIGFDNINMDVIIGLPGENLPMFENTLERISEMAPESLTVHTLAVKRASKLNEDRTDYSLIAGEEASLMVERAQEYARSKGMHPYYLYRQKNILGNLENIGYCKPDFESIYNIQIMEEKQSIIALGAGAVTKVVFPEENRIERAFNVKNVEEYIQRVDEMVERKKKSLFQGIRGV